MEQHETAPGLIPLLKKMLRCAQERMLQFQEEKKGGVKEESYTRGKQAEFYASVNFC